MGALRGTFISFYLDQGVPTQAALEARVTQVRRANAGAARPYDLSPVAAAAPTAVTPGLNYRVYEQATPWVPDWETQSAVAEGQTPQLDLAVRTREDDVGVELSGYLEVPTAGAYTFFLSTDTGAFVRLHDAQLLDADFGYHAGTEVDSGSVPLAAGRHPIRIFYRHATAADHTLSLSWQGPGINRAPIPASAWYHPTP